MKVLIACEFSGIVRDAFIRKGHDATSCDLIESESAFGPHYMGDIKNIINDGWDLMIATLLALIWQLAELGGLKRRWPMGGGKSVLGPIPV